MITLYGIPNCDTVKRARAWLANQGVTYRFHDFKREGLDATRLDRWLSSPVADQLLNRKGSTWRQLEAAAQQSAAAAAGARQLMLQQHSVIKRPVVEWPDGSLTVGFDEAAWAGKLG